MDPYYLIQSRFALPKITERKSDDKEIVEYSGVKYLVIPILGETIALRIDGRLILEWSRAGGIVNHADILDESICITGGIGYHYEQVVEYSC